LNRMKDKNNKLRVLFFCTIVVLSWGVIIARLFSIQVISGGEYQQIAERQSTGKITVHAERGAIYDRKGRQVAINVLRNALYAYPSSQREIREIGGYLDRIYGRRPGQSREMYPLKPNRFTWIDRNLGDDQAFRAARDSLPGLYIKSEAGRDYPFGRIGSQILGGTDIDGAGISGIEYSQDSILAGRPGLIDYLRDGQMNTYRIREVPLVTPTAGNSIVLTIDWHFQEIVEEELKLAVHKYNALEGSAIFLDCHTGEILAAADYVPAAMGGAVKLRGVSNSFEPGSVFKIFTAAALLEEDVVDLEEKIYCEKGFWKCGRGRLRDDKEHDSLIFKEVFELSSNIGFGKLALRLGGPALMQMARRFGFGQRCMIGLPGEQSGMIGDPGVWSEYNIAALAIGHAISVTPLQLAVAAGSIANGGELYRPVIVKGVINSDGKLISKAEKNLIGRVIDKDKDAILRSFMEGVVERGTGSPARSDIVSIAGKTGTAEVPDRENGGYIKNKFAASFLGYFPADEPQIAGIVLLHQPEPVHYGGHTSGPTFKNIAERYVVAHPELLKDNSGLMAEKHELKMIEIPDFINCDIGQARRLAEKRGIDLVANDSIGIVVWQYPFEGRKVPGTEKVVVMVRADSEKTLRMWDLRGMKMRTALAVLNHNGIDFEVTGSGIIKRQRPSAGSKIGENTKCILMCGTG